MNERSTSLGCIACLLGVVFVFASSLDGATSPSYRTIAPMSEARAGHTATVLQDGRVLITGGGHWVPYGGISRSAELFDRTAGTFSSIAPMQASAYGDTATLLTDGRVLLCGSSVQVYNPSDGIFSLISGSLFALGSNTATLLKDGRVLITSGMSAEIYDPVTGTFKLTGNPTASRSGHTATLLSDGRVLVAGGATSDICPSTVPASSCAVSSAEVYDPASGTFSPTGGMQRRRKGHAAVLLNDGRVLITGGGNGLVWSPLPGGSGAGCWAYDVTDYAEIYDPRTRSFAMTGTMAVRRVGHTATLLRSGNVLIAGGYYEQDCLGSAPIKQADARLEIYNVTRGTFSAPVGMAQGTYDLTASRLRSGEVLIAGGWSPGIREYFATAAAGLFEETHLPTRLAVSTATSATAGVVTSLTVTALDADGKTVTDYSGTVRFSSGDPLASLPVPVQLSSGTGTFSATFRTPGLVTITVEDVADPLIAGVSGTIAVAPSAALPIEGWLLVALALVLALCAVRRI